jgi:sugar phosphate isomerase/epimerase
MIRTARRGQTVKIQYAISLWNYFHLSAYAKVPSLEDICALLREQGYGLEAWGGWLEGWGGWEEERNLFGPIGRQRLKRALQGMPVSMHGGDNTMELHMKHIDCAAYVGAGVIVIHPENIPGGEKSCLDIAFARDIVAYAGEKGVRLALENGKVSDLVHAVEHVPGLGICLDVGHLYPGRDPMKMFLTALKEHIMHLHIQDTLPELEAGLPLTDQDHYTPGTGGIPRRDWEMLAVALGEINYEGAAVFEIRPRNPLQTALLGRTFFQGILADG